MFTSPNPPQFLSSVEAIIRDGIGAPDVVAELRAATGDHREIDTSAGGLITTFSAPDLSGPAAIRLFTPDSPVTLQPNVRYWFILGSDNAGTFGWDYANDDITTGFGLLENFSDSNDAGATWTLRDSAFPYFVRVNSSSAIPEATGIVLAGGLVGVTVALGRRRRRS